MSVSVGVAVGRVIERRRDVRGAIGGMRRLVEVRIGRAAAVNGPRNGHGRVVEWVLLMLLLLLRLLRVEGLSGGCEGDLRSGRGGSGGGTRGGIGEGGRGSGQVRIRGRTGVQVEVVCRGGKMGRGRGCGSGRDGGRINEATGLMLMLMLLLLLLGVRV